ncbi:hypothetical protein K458DRAFT_403419 [Lentithecium fluviatile CBS 122367]|uniref:Uncharacterized protein n=1 Tax=Lentithecium fluviatile CBS 122367 TaxID=1168545 RepID=A0A6G1J3T9_9PLEO|nr:hypothetical protein K458DRAFT_403419 [Lentithecium fluviatile CBS 122367]
MCFGGGTSYKVKSKAAWGDSVSEETSGAVARPRRYSIRRYGPQGSYYPAHYYAQPPNYGRAVGALQYPGHFQRHGGVVPHGALYGGGRQFAGGRAAMPSHAAMPPLLRASRTHPPTTATLYNTRVHSAMAAQHGFPQPRQSYLHVPQPGRRGVLVHNGQIPNGAAPSGVVPGGYFQGGFVGGHAGAVGGVIPGGIVGGARVGGVVAGGFHPGVYAAPNYHSRPFYYGPNAAASTYGTGYYNYPSYSYYSPYASYGLGVGLYANYYHPYQRSYYYPTAVAAPAVACAVPAVVSASYVPAATTTYTVTNSHIPAMRTTTTTRTNMPPVMQAPGPARLDIQMENRRIATERGAYNVRNIKPDNVNPDEPFWCMERTGEWHLRTFYQIENECYPGRWHINPDQGFLVFHRA